MLMVNAYKRPTQTKTRPSSLGFGGLWLRGILLLGLSPVWIPACQTPIVKPVVSCEDIDWFELGRQDGIQGLSWDRFLTFKQECTDATGTSNNTLYSAGYKSGLADYCSWKNGVELGHSISKVPEICPIMYHKRMALAIKLGQQLQRLQNENQKLDLELNRRKSLLSSNKLGVDDEARLQKEIQLLKSKQANTSRLLKDLEAKVDSQVF
jgi:hypothetical protein